MRAPLAGAHNALREIHQSPKQRINRNKYQRHNPSHRFTHPLCLCCAHGANRRASERRAQEGRVWSLWRKSGAKSYRKTAPTARRTGKLITNAGAVLGLTPRPPHEDQGPGTRWRDPNSRPRSALLRSRAPPHSCVGFSKIGSGPRNLPTLHTSHLKTISRLWQQYPCHIESLFKKQGLEKHDETTGRGGSVRKRYPVLSPLCRRPKKRSPNRVRARDASNQARHRMMEGLRASLRGQCAPSARNSR